MKKSKFSDSQIIEALKRVEGGLSVPGQPVMEFIQNRLCSRLAYSSSLVRRQFGDFPLDLVELL